MTYNKMTTKKMGYCIFYENHREINERIAGMYEYVVFETKEEAQKVVDSLNNTSRQHFVLLENGMTEEEYRKKTEERREYHERYQKASEAKRQHNALVWDYHKTKDRMDQEHRAIMKKMEDDHEKERRRLISIMNLVPSI